MEPRFRSGRWQFQLNTIRYNNLPHKPTAEIDKFPHGSLSKKKTYHEIKRRTVPVFQMRRKLTSALGVASHNDDVNQTFAGNELYLIEPATNEESN